MSHAERIQYLIHICESKFGPDIAKDINYALDYAKDKHNKQLRSSGEPYVIHPIEVAIILMDLEMDPSAVKAGLLHDVVEDTEVELEEIASLFGTEVALLVDGVTKLGRIEYKTKKERQAESLRKMLLAMAKDIRVIIIKLADRLHNLRTLEYVEEAKQREKGYETLEIYAPLANRLGISKIKWELEDTSLRYIDPRGYYDLVEKVAEKRQQRQEYVDFVSAELKKGIDKIGIKAEIAGRPKHFYSIYRKMMLQHKEFNQIFDLVAMRVIVDSVKDCYGVLGIAHTLWKPIPGRFKDYIAVPKANMYQSLHTTVIGPKGEPFEIQIRTTEMHYTAEYGIAAHWKYKEGKNGNDSMDDKLAWLRQLLEWQGDLKDSNEFMEALKIDLFSDEVFVFTPKGDVKDLIKGAIPLDFAYAIHSAIGNKCVGAKVNGKMVPLDYELKTGDIVEILTSVTTKGPSRDWLKIVKTNQAKNKIKQWFKKERREENIENGKQMLEKNAKHRGFVFEEIARAEWIEDLIKKYGFHSVEDLYSAIGYGGITPAQINNRLINLYNEENKKEEELTIDTMVNKPQALRKISVDKGIVVKGIDNVLVRFAKCCNPVKGDNIIGYVTRGRGVSVHRSDCPNLFSQSLEQERLLEVSWDEQEASTFNANIEISANDSKKILLDVTNAINEMKLVISEMSARTTKDHTAIINLTLEIKNIEQLDYVIKKFKAIKDVINVYRCNG